MKVFTCTDHPGHYPTGVASVIVADTEDEARQFLNAALVLHGLTCDTPFTLNELDTRFEQVLVLNDGNY